MHFAAEGFKGRSRLVLRGGGAEEKGWRERIPRFINSKTHLRLVVRQLEAGAGSVGVGGVCRVSLLQWGGR